MVWLLDISLLKLKMVDQLPTSVQAISLQLTKIPKKFPWQYPKKNLKNVRQKQPCHHFTAVVSSVNTPISYHLLHAEP